MKDEFRKMWGNYRSWVHYMLDYKSNKTYCEIKEAENKEKDELIERLNDKISGKVKDELLEKKENRICLLNTKISELMKSKKEVK